MERGSSSKANLGEFLESSDYVNSDGPGKIVCICSWWCFDRWWRSTRGGSPGAATAICQEFLLEQQSVPKLPRCKTYAPSGKASGSGSTPAGPPDAPHRQADDLSGTADGSCSSSRFCALHAAFASAAFSSSWRRQHTDRNWRWFRWRFQQLWRRRRLLWRRQQRRQWRQCGSGQQRLNHSAKLHHFQREYLVGRH
jgi:hypothetical protein